MAKVKGSFVVIPSQFEEDEPVKGYAFKNNSDSTEFAKAVQKFSRRLYAKMMGFTTTKTTEDGKEREIVDKEKLKNIPQGVCFDVLIQPLDKDGQPAGDPMEFDQLRD